MHELSITRNIVAIVAEAAGGRRVSRVTLDIGVLSAVVPDALRFCFDVVSAGTAVAGAELVVREVQAAAHCRNCGADFLVDAAVAVCACGSRELALTGGDELTIRTMEVDEELAACV
jgi:hydrogenase nickel incorporation protein HypA/HybF